jgi:hypothetical protein
VWPSHPIFFVSKLYQEQRQQKISSLSISSFAPIQTTSARAGKTKPRNNASCEFLHKTGGILAQQDENHKGHEGSRRNAKKPFV